MKKDLGRTEEELWEHWFETRDLKTRLALVELYLPLVQRQVARVSATVASSVRPELMSFGVVGLFDAVEKFQPGLGHTFQTYAPFRIRGEILDGIRSMSWLPRAALRPGSGKIDRVITLDFNSVDPGQTHAVADRLVDTLEAPIFDDLIREAEHGAVVEAVRALSDRDRHVITQYYYGGLRLTEIAEEMGVTESRVCQIHRGALRRLKSLLAEPLSA